MTLNDVFYYGVITKPKGFKGELHFKNDAPDIELDDIKSVYLLIGKHLAEYEVEKISTLGDKGHVKFEGIDNEKDAASLLKTKMYLSIEEFPEMEDNESIQELVGYKVFDEKMGLVGEVYSVNDSTPQVLLNVKNGKKEIYIPLVEQFVKQMDAVKREIHFELPDGLLDLND
ncbi:MAG: ribosome maturation factor RimM [Flavobacteriales bacterium]